MTKLNWRISSPIPTGLRGYLPTPWSFEETVARLITLSGQPARSSDIYKSSVNFTGTFDGHYFTLYDYKEDRRLHIGVSNNELPIFDMIDVLVKELAKVEPTPYVAEEFYEERIGHSWGQRYDSRPALAMTKRERTTDAAWWRSVAERLDNLPLGASCVGLCYFVDTGGRQEDTTRRTIQLWYMSPNNIYPGHWWPICRGTIRSDEWREDMAGSTYEDRILACLILAAAIEEGDI